MKNRHTFDRILTITPQVPFRHITERAERRSNWYECTADHNACVPSPETHVSSGALSLNIDQDQSKVATLTSEQYRIKRFFVVMNNSETYKKSYHINTRNVNILTNT